MNPFEIAAFVMAAAVVAGGAFYWRRLVLKKRIEALGRLALEMRWTFSPGRDETLPSSLGQGFHLFSLGHSKRASNVMRGSTSRGRAIIFDYQYTIGRGKERRTSHRTVLCLGFEGKPIPRFALRPENVLHKIGAAFGYRDIDFESFPEFSKRYLLRGEDEMAIRDFFNAGVISFFEREGRLCMEGGDGNILLYPARGQLKPENIRPFLTKGEELLGLLKG
jgi:hypothetical protein